ncbi:MAG: hypothetical protein LBQ38_00665 [Spirochaetaceae bacterium]|jgi:hypothetical protein|nr:hypothetical protein [Spirochaetaceae bacterium]
MGRIKSALEIALERTGAVKSDKSSIEQFEAKQQGKRLANQFLEDGKQAVLEEGIKKTPRERQTALKQGIFDILLSQLGLPLTGEDEKRITAAGKGLQAVIGDPRFGAVNKQLGQILSRYLDQSAQYEEAIKRQYAPKLRQKEEELSRRLGRQVQIDPFQDPEFAAFYNQNMNALKGSYQSAVDQVREEAIRLFEKR